MGRQRGGSSEPNGPNENANDAARAAGLNDYQMRKFHERLSDDPESDNYSYQELLEIAKDIKSQYSGHQ